MRGSEVLICPVLITHSWGQKIRSSKLVLREGSQRGMGGDSTEAGGGAVLANLLYPICPRGAVAAPKDPFHAPHCA